MAAKSLTGRFDNDSFVLSTLHRTVGNAYSGLGQYVSARQHLSEALEIHEANFPGQTELKIELQLGIARCEIRLDRLSEANDVLSQVLLGLVENRESMSITKGIEQYSECILAVFQLV